MDGAQLRRIPVRRRASARGSPRRSAARGARLLRAHRASRFERIGETVARDPASRHRHRVDALAPRLSFRHDHLKVSRPARFDALSQCPGRLPRLLSFGTFLGRLRPPHAQRQESRRAESGGLS